MTDSAPHDEASARPAATADRRRGSKGQQRRPQRAALFVLLLVLAAPLAFWLWGAWNAAALREAYLPDLEEITRRSPGNGVAQALRGGRLIDAGEYPAAADALRAAIAAGEAQTDVWLNLAAADAVQGNLSQAADDLQRAHEKRPNDPELEAVGKRLRQGVAAGSPMDAAAKICPEGPYALIKTRTRGSFLNGLMERWGSSHPEESGFATRARWVRERPDDPRALRLWGLALLRNRRYPEAREALGRAVEKAPDSAEARLALGDALLRMQQPRPAAGQYLACLKLRPRWLPALLDYGQASLNAGTTPAAVDAFTQATQVAPQSVEAWVGLGKADVLTGVQYAPAVEAFEKALRLAPNRTDFLADYADALRLAGRVDDAEKAARRYLQSNPSDPYAHFLVGRILTESNPTPEREAEAEKETREALRLAPDNARAQTQLGSILLRRGRVPEALAVLQDAQRRDPYSVSRMRILARGLAQAGKEQEARTITAEADALYAAQQRVSVLESREASEMTSPALHEELARLYDRGGKPERAQAERNFVRMLRQDPKKAAEALEKYRAERRDAFKNP